VGVNISSLIEAKNLELSDLRGRSIAIDAHNVIYQFLSIIRQPDGTPLKDSQGRVTSHLSGLLNRSANLLENGISPSFVFDGKPPEMKTDTLEYRRERRIQALEDWKQARESGDLEKAFSKASQSSRLTNDILESSRLLLQGLGIPVVEAPGEGEAQAAYMCRQGDIYAAGSQDYDSLLFGAPRLVRNMAVTGRRKMPGAKGLYRTVNVEIIHLDQLLEDLQIDRLQLVDMCIMIGTDFHKGIAGVGPKRGLKLIREHGDLLGALQSIGMEIEDFQSIRDIFLHADHNPDYDLRLGAPDREAVKELLCETHDFSPARVDSVLDKIELSLHQQEEQKRQQTLDKWF
jgi:flap endonuclease-1